ncbi:aminopeptidase P family protein [Roseiconus nitratireducens]|uniref:Aminopeptidase P family protein n=1 Tax=Roseiconus nitratireducens TaxID=2605748 RepID=A0A5M6CVM8_9BACT|nr:Xaa-Pro peptidase family protein [Roseiconus nitratireducens]KAA5539307.1 aminopeptidase P family protein [Roseiconus nitratireducens]
MTPRIERLADQLGALEMDALLVTDEINVRYLTGFTGDSSALLVEPGKALLISDGRYKKQLDEECPGVLAAIRSPSEKPLDFLAEIIKESGAGRVGIEADQMTVTTFSGLRARLPQQQWCESSGVILKQRMIKDPQEIRTLRQAVRINERALQSVLAKLGPDWTEQEIAYDLEATIRRLGGEGFSFEPIIGAGPGGAKPHYHSRPVVIGNHSTLLIDWGTLLGGYASDLTRTFHFGSPPANFERAYQAVLDSQLAAIERIAPGVATSEIDAAARDVLDRAGLGDRFVHGLGHGVGLQIHESPRLSATSDETLAPGMVITVEPGVYFEGEFGIRIEDDVLVTENGHEVLSGFPKGLDDCRLIL